MRPTTAGVTRAVALAAALAAVGLLPWLSGRDPALTVLRARSAEQEPTEEALSAIRQDLGLDAGPLSLLGDWATGLLRGDFGTSWVSGTAAPLEMRYRRGTSRCLPSLGPSSEEETPASAHPWVTVSCDRTP